MVAQARQDGDKALAEAKEKAEAMLAALRVRIEQTEKFEIAPIVAEGQQQAQLTREQADQYIDRLRNKLAVKKEKIIADFIDNALNPE